ncbi:UxaA family hydrolase [Alicyclobacillus fastidiosus]|uniref:UxaA family hydrolase n=1 Tax=Alicyclobacillus fastidiosus TaxID=392011 RepID=A0ABY6ZEG8_9BACL|nr:UxaA family hydrolase [Alicyclobacillus fastidiosus]WAH40535.1 UxaA family hydrolase [Alicyclobacillus fastidiosus]GMA61965.1 D-galactarate dehydratase [Alicyclobacillus fastidiosus]
MESNRQWVLQKPVDDVATALTRLQKGTEIVIEDAKHPLVLVQDIPFGHKFAIRDLPVGAHVHKYGQVIGRATQMIRAGEHVHVHNLESLRGRGDLQRGESSVQNSSLFPG